MAIQEAARAQFGSTVKAFGSFGRIRRARNNFEYPSTITPGPSPDDVRDAITTATQARDAAMTILEQNLLTSWVNATQAGRPVIRAYRLIFASLQANWLSARRAQKFYHPDTNVLITRFFAAGGVGEIQDFMPVGGAAEARRHRLIRRVLCVRGTMPFRARVAPRFGYGTDPHTLTEVESGVVFTAPGLTVGLTATVPVGHDGRDVTAEFKLAEGETAVFALDEAASGAEPIACSGEEAEKLLSTSAGGRLSRISRRITHNESWPRILAPTGENFL